MRKSRLLLASFAAGISALAWNAAGTTVSYSLQKPREVSSAIDAVKSHGSPVDRLIPDELLLEVSGLSPADSSGGSHGNGTGAGTSRGNAFVNDPCLDPSPNAPDRFFRTVQSETEIAVLNSLDEEDDDGDDDDDEDRDRRGFDGNRDDDDHDDGHGGNSSGKLMVAGYNDSFGFRDNRQGLSGFSYSTDGGKQWIDAGSLPPLVPSGAPAGTPGSDAYFGDPVVQVHHRTKQFYYASIYQTPAGIFSLSVNRGEFKVAPQQSPVESYANTRCEANPALHGVPDPPPFVQKRIIWEPPVVAVAGTFLAPDDFLDKEWLYVNQETGVLYLTYTRFGSDGSTPIELVRSFDGGQTWTAPSVIVPNLLDTFNQATQPVVTPTGRVIVTFLARTFPVPTFVEREQRIEAAFSDDCTTPAPCTFGPPVIVDVVNPQGEPPGYNRGRTMILNAPSITVDKGRDDGRITNGERRKRGFGNVYITYFDGLTPLRPAPQPQTNLFARAGNISLSRSTDNGTTYNPPVTVNDDPGDTSHVFPSVHVNKHAEVFVTWLDRRVDRPRNLLTDTWGDISGNHGASFGTDGRISTVSTDWITREDARPDYGDYNSGEVINFQHFASIWADGRFPTPGPLTMTPSGGFTRPSNQAATPDTLFAIVKRGGPRRDRD